ncbi:MAG: hypothetical protein ACFFG0_00685 [Candidatus Thorarchaeota archaeon]
MKITLVKRIYEIYENDNMTYPTQVGKFIKSIKSSFIQPIPNTGIIFKNENFFIEEVVQDADSNVMVLFEDTQFSCYDINEKLPKLKEKLKVKGWIWEDGNNI